MSTEESESMGTKPVAEHAWLNQLLGTWNVESTMNMGPGTEPATGKGIETVTSFGGLWARAEGKGTMPNGEEMQYIQLIGYDVSFKEYRGCWVADVSSHVWKYVGEMSADGKKLTMTCEGPDMVEDGKTALYRDVIEIIDADHRTMTSFGQDADGNWNEFMKAVYTRA